MEKGKKGQDSAEKVQGRDIPAFCVAGTHSDCGKTTVSLGIMAALVRRGLQVQAYKVGPDFIDPGHHRRVTGRDSHNLDSWILGPRENREIFYRYLQGADAAVVEGVMGLFDGFSGGEESGSTALLSKWLNLPVALVIDARSMARSAAAVALGFSCFDEGLPLRGVIFNRVAGRGHAEMLREAMSRLPHLSLYGCLPWDKELEIPSRHLGLVTDEDFSMEKGRIGKLGSWIEDHLDLESLLACRVSAAGGWVPSTVSLAHPSARIGVAMDEAFCFYYPENLRLLREAGAELVPFSPIRDKSLPEGIKGLILGGGYPELHCRSLSENRQLLSSVRRFGLEGRPIYAECGGFMVLMEEITDMEGKSYPMAGFFPASARMESHLHTLGYREIVTVKESLLGPPGTRVRGHEFHFSRILKMVPSVERVYSLHDRRASACEKEGFQREKVLGSYVHLHWGSHPEVAMHFVEQCRRYG